MNIFNTSGTNVVIPAMWNVAPDPTCISDSRIKARFPAEASDSIYTEVPAPILKILEILKTEARG